MPPRKTASKDPEPLPRSARKDLTRAKLLQAALTLMGEGRSFTSLGLREIAREAGVVPNAFYRHFRNTDELGLVLVEEVGITLRRLLREARKMDVAPSDIATFVKSSSNEPVEMACERQPDQLPRKLIYGKPCRFPRPIIHLNNDRMVSN